MVNVKTALASARKDGTENTAHSVSTQIAIFISILSTLFLSHTTFFPSQLTAGCENGCSRHGQCTLENGEYRCDCIEGWAGSDCSTPLEMNCNDGIDNDKGKHHILHYIDTVDTSSHRLSLAMKRCFVDLN